MAGTTVQCCSFSVVSRVKVDENEVVDGPPIPRSRSTFYSFAGVIVICLLLLGLLFPAIQMPHHSLRAQARADIMQIAAAIRQYEKEYGRPPIAPEVEEESAPDVTVGLGGMHNNLVFNVLRSRPIGANRDDHLNPRKIVFFEAKDVPNPTNPCCGFLEKGTIPELKGSYFDPWGNEYLIGIHYNAKQPFIAPDGAKVEGDVIVWSLGGPDGSRGATGNIVSWK